MTHDAGAFGAIPVGRKEEFTYVITQDVYAHFLAAFRDTNPLHADDGFARAHGFDEKVAHGAILNGFVSHFVGVHFPGGACVLHSVQMTYKTPCHVGDEVRLEAEVVQAVESVRVLVMDVKVVNTTRGRTAARAKVQVGIL